MRQDICSVAITSAVALGCLFAGANAQRPMAAEADAVPCVAPKDITRLDLPLGRTARHLASHKLTMIVALGSSSTSGAGASSAATTYPSRLMVELAHRFPTQSSLMVLNRGIAGARAVNMLARFDETVAAEHPDLVLWQLGTNAVLRGYEHSKSDAVVRDGIRRMKAIGADVVLIDPQFAPKVIANPEIDDMIDLLSGAAAEENVNVFHRFALMRHWHDRIPFETFLSSDACI
jgi:acyl-CoA thioesterase-1